MLSFVSWLLQYIFFRRILEYPHLSDIYAGRCIWACLSMLNGCLAVVGCLENLFFYPCNKYLQIISPPPPPKLSNLTVFRVHVLGSAHIRQVPNGKAHMTLATIFYLIVPASPCQLLWLLWWKGGQQGKVSYSSPAPGVHANCSWSQQFKVGDVTPFDACDGLLYSHIALPEYLENMLSAAFSCRYP